MSVYSDYKVGALSETEYHNLCVEENARERYEREYIDDFERGFYEQEDLVIESEDEYE